MTNTCNIVPVLRTPSSCTTHTLPDIPVGLGQPNAEYAGGFLYLCGGYNLAEDPAVASGIFHNSILLRYESFNKKNPKEGSKGPWSAKLH